MMENSSPPVTPEKLPSKEVEALQELFIAAEKLFEIEGREKAKLLLNTLYKGLQQLNGSDMSDWTKIWIWNPEGALTETDFNELNLRRKKLSNAIGIMAKAEDGTVYIRHDLNDI